MAALLALKKKLKALKGQKPDVPPSTKDFKVQDGWKQLLEEEVKVPYVKGWHHFYEGIQIDKTEKKGQLLFAGRDMVLSFALAHRVESSSTEVVQANYLIDLFSDVAALRGKNPGKTLMYTTLRKTLSYVVESLNLDESNLTDLSSDTYLENLIGKQTPAQMKTILELFKKPNDTIPERSVDQAVLILAAGLLHTSGKMEFEYSLCIFLMSVAKTGSVSSNQLVKKTDNFKSQFGFSSPFLVKMGESTCSYVWSAIASELKVARLTTQVLMDNIYQLVCLIDNVLVTPLAEQVAYRNQTAIVLIVRAMTSLTDFPWTALVSKNPSVATEMEILLDYLDTVANDKYIGLVMAGCSKDLPNLAYLCFQLNKQVLGATSLDKYRGTGSTGEGINRAYFDTLVKEYMADQSSSLGSYIALKELESRAPSIRASMKRISDFFSSKRGPDDDNDDPDGGQPGPGKRRIEESSDAEPASKTPRHGSSPGKSSTPPGEDDVEMTQEDPSQVGLPVVADYPLIRDSSDDVVGLQHDLVQDQINILAVTTPSDDIGEGKELEVKYVKHCLPVVSDHQYILRHASYRAVNRSPCAIISIVFNGASIPIPQTAAYSAWLSVAGAFHGRVYKHCPVAAAILGSLKEKAPQDLLTNPSSIIKYIKASSFVVAIPRPALGNIKKKTFWSEEDEKEAKKSTPSTPGGSAGGSPRS